MRTMMSVRIFSFWILVCSVGMMHFFYIVRTHLDQQHGLQAQVYQLKEQIRREEMRTQLAYHQLKDFQQTVATLIPEASKGLPEDQKRTIASLVIEPNLNKLKIDTSSNIYEKGKAAYRENNFDQAASLFNDLIKNYPLSKHTIDAYFLLSESRFQAGEVDDCLETIDSMVTLFPEHDLTGFALLRMGQILSARDRFEDAEEIFKLTLREFDNKQLREQASRLLKEISL